MTQKAKVGEPRPAPPHRTARTDSGLPSRWSTTNTPPVSVPPTPPPPPPTRRRPSVHAASTSGSTRAPPRPDPARSPLRPAPVESSRTIRSTEITNPTSPVFPPTAPRVDCSTSSSLPGSSPLPHASRHRPARARQRYITRSRVESLPGKLVSPIQSASQPPLQPQPRSRLFPSSSNNGDHGSRRHGRGPQGSSRQHRRRAGHAPLRGRPQEPAPERRPVPVHPGDERVPARARVHEGAPRDHRQPPMEPDDDVGGRGPVPQHAAQAYRRQEDHGDRRLHRLLPPRHRARHPRRRHHLGHGHQPRELRAGAAVHREGRRGAQDRLPRGTRAPRAGRAAGGRGQPRQLRLRLRGRRQGQLPQLPRAADEARQGRRPPRLRQHPLERLRRAPRRRPHAQVHPLLPRLRPRAQQGPRRRPTRRDLPAPRRRRHHPLPPRQVIGSGTPISALADSRRRSAIDANKN